MIPSTWLPPADLMPTHTLPFLDAWERFLQTFSFPLGSQNLSIPQQQALDHLAHRKDIIVRRADKGNNTVVISRPRYIEMAEKMLGSPVYEKVNSIPNIQAEFAGIRVILAGRVPPKIMKQVMSPGHKTPHLYGLLKLQKDTLALRPIVSQCNRP